jgi:DNA-binding ferritin-like protein
MDIGINKKDREKIANGLSNLLADSYTLYLMTHNFHWNVTGPMFNTLHVMFMQQYTEQWTALDLIAERIRALGLPAPGTYKEFVKRASIKGRRPAESQGDDCASGGGTGGGGAYRSQPLAGGRQGQRPADSGFADSASGRT